MRCRSSWTLVYSEARTFFYMTVGMVKPDSGEVLLNDEDLTEYPMHLRARKGVGYLQPSIFRKLTVKQNIMAILEALSLPKDEQEERTGLLLENSASNIWPTRKPPSFPGRKSGVWKSPGHHNKPEIHAT